MLSGDNGILQKATEAKTNTETANEKEQIQMEVLGSYSNNGELKITTVNSNIKNNINGVTTDDAIEFPLIVTYTSTGNRYSVDEDGNVDTFRLANTTWQDNVTYKLDESLHTITIYKGTKPTHVGDYNGDVVIKNKAVIAEIEYTTLFPSNCNNLFSGESNMTSFSMENIDTSNVTNMGYMFFGCTSLENIDLSYFDTDNVTLMDFMFSDCSSLGELDLSSFKVNNVTSMSGMFSNVSAKLDLSGWVIKNDDILSDTRYCTSRLFIDCKSREIIAKNWNVSNASNLSGVFHYGSTNLETLDISNWTFGTEHVAQAFFVGCTSLRNITGINEWQLSNFNLNAGPFAGICQNCTALGNKLTGGMWDNGTWSNGTFTPST